MKIVLLPYCFYPDAVGGTEIYVERLARELMKMGHEPVIAAPAKKFETYFHDGLRVVRYADGGPFDTEAVYRQSCPETGRWFGEWLRKESVDIVHFHAATAGHPKEMFEAAQSNDIPVVLTYHTPTVTCPRGTMMRWGRKPCDGRMRILRCTACMLHSKGLARPAAGLMAALPADLLWSMGRGLSGKLSTFLGIKKLVQWRIEASEARFRLSDRVVAVCDWVRDTLRINRVAESKIRFSRQGITVDAPNLSVPRPAPELVVGYMGRMAEEKGIDLLIASVRLLPRSVRIQCLIYGVVSGEGGQAYFEAMKKMASGDHRIVFKSMVQAEETQKTMAAFDLLAVPSRWLETGPLVTLEAFAAGVPVIGAKRGGVAELVEDGVNGILIDSYSPQRWADALRRLSEDRGTLVRLQKNVSRAVKTMAVVAREMADIYEPLLKRRDA